MKTAAADVQDSNRKQVLLNKKIGEELNNVRTGIAEVIKDLPTQENSRNVVYSSNSGVLPPLIAASFSDRVNELTPAREHKRRILDNIRAKSVSNSPVVQSVVLENDQESDETSSQGSSNLDLPPFVFRRLPKLEEPIVNIESMKNWDDKRDKVGMVEGWLDNVFSNDKIYENVILKLREQILQLEARNNMLESNLDTAEIEIEYWRDVYKRKLTSAFSAPTNNGQGPQLSMSASSKLSAIFPGSGRQVAERTWKLAISKFVGSGEQFLLLKVLYHWRMHVLEHKGQEEGETDGV